MKQLLAILVGSTLVFMALAMAQEWEVFAPLLGAAPAEAPPEAVPPAVEETVERFNTMLVHLYRFGDPRFLDRLPATDPVKARLTDDLGYLSRNGLRQELRPLSRRTVSSRRLDGRRFEVLTEEGWQLRYLDTDGQPLNDRPMSFVINWRYVVAEGPDGLRIAAMGPAPGA
jgi:hypothetical protein